MNKPITTSDGISSIIFILVASQFPSGGYFIHDDGLLGFWFLTFTCILVVAMVDRLVEQKRDIYQLTFTIFNTFYSGVWLGLSLGSALIVSDWYTTGDGNKYEPLFIVTTLSSAIIAFLNNKMKTLEKECILVKT